MEKQTKLTWKRFFASPLFFVVGIGLLIMLSISLTRAQFSDRQIRSEIAQLEFQVQELEGERAGYEEFLSLLKTPQFLEKEARRSLGYVLPGEKIVVIEQQDKRDTRDKQDEQELSNPRKWWIYFFGGS
ncbi:septum formation initiator family protein [Candidatus Uhrbacteria bacterium]|nr:septum formation initiator family protein [Candidatus Uhrbacteria bacterium]